MTGGSTLIAQAVLGGILGAVLCVGGLVIVGLVLWVISIYNQLARLRIAGQGAFADIDVQLRRRHDLIPNLVETVKGYATHERETLDAVISARAKATSATVISDKIAAEGQLTQALGRLMAVAEAYPDLKANQNFLQLQGELGSTENMIARSRSGYNSAAGRYNDAIVVFPNNVLAGVFKFEAMPFYEEKDPAAKEAPKVKF
ncbi:MAG: LemA family protein [Phycisphaeraceae bacterium]|nr:LemA family protein [Phycisphaeraceae bacterium]